MNHPLHRLNKAFDSRIRLGLVAALAARPAMDFKELKELLQLTDGNLASHLKPLEKEGFIEVEKSFIDRKPNTRYRLTAAGRTALQEHIAALEQLIALQKDHTSNS